MHKRTLVTRATKTRTTLMISAVVTLWLLLVPATAQVPGLFELGTADADRSGLLGNGITDLFYANGTVYVGSGFGLATSPDNGESWINFRPADYTPQQYGAQRGGTSAITVGPDGTVWIAVAYDTLVEEESTPLSIGGGLRYLEPGSTEWGFVPQPVDAISDTSGGMKPTTTRVQNLTFDIAVTDSQIWISSFGGGVRRSLDRGETWEVITTDGLPFDAGNDNNLNHRGFAAMADTSDNIWIGTAGGVSVSEDGGETWEQITFSNRNFPISGNWVIGLFHNPWDNSVWATTLRTVSESEFNAISSTSNLGETWQIHLQDELADGTFPRYVAFHDSAVYVATEKGVYKSINNGESWFKFPAIRDQISGEELRTSTYYSVTTSPTSFGGHNLWVGSLDGLAATDNSGFDWTIYRAFVSTRERTDPAVYAYPNPYSPSHSDRPCRFQFDVESASSVSIDIYNFAMERVITLREQAAGPTNGSFDRSVIWDGTDQFGYTVANGVYFFRADVGGEVSWGKIAIIN